MPNCLNVECATCCACMREIGRGILQDPIQETALIDQAIQPNTTLKSLKGSKTH